MTTDSRLGQHPVEGGHTSRRFRAFRLPALRAAAIGGALIMAAGTGIGMAANASAAAAPAAHTAAAPAPQAKNGFFPGKPDKDIFLTKVFVGHQIRVDGIRSQSIFKIKRAIAFCPRGWVATGGGFLALSHLSSVVGSFPFPSHPWATPVAWVVLVKHKWFGPGSPLDVRPDFVKAFVVCSPIKIPHLISGDLGHGQGGAPSPMARPGAGA